MWVYCSGQDNTETMLADVKNIVLLDYQASRARSCIENVIGEYQGYLQSDGYVAYDGIENVKHLGSLAHARRKFMDAKKCWSLCR